MKGTKRLGVSESNSDIKDSISQSKRMLVGSQFDIHRAEPSQVQPVDAPSLDMQRAELSRQHVRALNNQFASWIQTQLQNNPDELWEDGAQDYLNHASNILCKFSDVVDWLKAKSAVKENLSSLESQTAPKKLLSDGSKISFSGISPAGETAGFSMSWGNSIQKNLVSEGKDNNEIKTFPEKPAISTFGSTAGFPLSWGSSFQNKALLEIKDKDIKEPLEKPGFAPPASSSPFGTTWAAPAPSKVASTENNSNGITTFTEKPGIIPASTTTGFGMSWGSAPIFGSQSSFSFGNQNSVPVNNNISNDTEDGDDIEQPSSPSVKKSEEKGVTVVHEMKCKLYVKSSDPADKDAWKDKGTGQLSIKCKEGFNKGSKDSKPTIVVRNDVGKILLNALLYPGIKTNMQKNSIVTILHTSEDDNNDNVVARTFLIRARTEDDRNKLALVIQEHAPAA